MWKMLCLAISVVVLASPAVAAIVKFQKGIGWHSYRDLANTRYAQRFNELKNKGYMLIDVDAYKVGSSMRYSMVWRQNTENRGWASYRNMTSAQYNTRWNEYKNKGYRPLDIESYRVNGAQRYAGIWVQNKEGYSWSSRRNLTATQYGAYFQEQKNLGRRVIDIEAYQTSGGLRYSAIWVENKENIQWAQFRDMTRASYQTRVTNRSNSGYTLVEFESYRSGGKQRYAAIWEKRSGYARQVRTGRTEKQFANLWREYRDKGYRLVDFERYSIGSRTRYGGVWIENRSRYRYSKKGAIDSKVSKYRADNNLPGISVAVIRNGTTLYQRGFGFADTGAQKVAHGGTVYSAASISKVVAGTIAVRLQERGRLRNGRRVSLNLNNTTRSYLTNVRRSNGTFVTLPSAHTHKVKQVFAHLSCIDHYDGPEPSSGHYVRAIDALPQIWSASFVSPCTVGTTRSYSTHGFTYIAAVLEKVTGRRSTQLIRSEIAVPHGLPTMRALWASSSVPSNYDRAIPYRNNNTATTTSDNSWKIFGGGIEVSTVDLARFGWKVLNGNIVSASARDSVLWKRVRSNRRNGIAWEVRTRDGRRVAEHGGSWTGALTRLRVYRDDGLVIAIMSNRRNHTVGNLSSLASAIANEVLGAP